jgi:Family of unknown function (DUF5317)
VGAVVGLVAATLRGPNWAGLADLRWRLAWLCLLGFAIRVVIVSGPESVVGPLLPVAPALNVLSITLVVISMLANWRLPGFPLIAFGASLNLLAIVANGGQMPTTLHAERATLFAHVAELGDQARLAVLGDWLEAPYLPERRFSIGDVVIAIGTGAAAYKLARRKEGPEWRSDASC